MNINSWKYMQIFSNNIYTVCVFVYIYIINIHSAHTYII